MKSPKPNRLAAVTGSPPPESPAPLPSPTWKRGMAAALTRWFAGSKRDLPWRRTADLYSIWVSEVMLQQTQVATVIPYFERFLARFPTPQSLAEAEEAEVLRLWEGLGYYRRARQLHSAAKQIVAEHGGVFPQTFAEVCSLPGVGRYTAGAVLSIGLDQQLPILEANSVRVLARLSGYAGPTTSTAGQKHLWRIAEAVLPVRNCGAFNQALMELGSAICTPKNPVCDECPVRTWCRAQALDAQDRIPAPKPRIKFEEVLEAAAVVRRNDAVLVRQCQPGERWAGLWDFPRFRLLASAESDEAVKAELARKLAEAGLKAEVGDRLTTIKHGVTRFRITLAVYVVASAKWPRSDFSKAASPLQDGSGRWLPVSELATLPLSVTGRKIARLLT